MACKKVVSVIGSGNWGSTIGKIVGHNVKNLENFETQVKMWVFEEMVNNRKLTEIINGDHENPKYLPGIELPENLVAIPDVVECTIGSDYLIFVLPHQHLQRVINQMKGHVKSSAYGVSLIKGLHVDPNGGMALLTDLIRDQLNIQCGVLMGANLASEVSEENECEATIGCANLEIGAELKQIFQTSYFRMVVTQDEVCPELCGALKNIVAVGAGFVVGMKYGSNTKAAVIRLGLKEMIKFIKTYYGDRGILETTFFESCGIADLITTCDGGRNRKVAVAFAETGKSIAELEKELLNGQSAQGPLTAKEVYDVLKAKGQLNEYPIFVAVHRICAGEMEVTKFLDAMRNHPEHE